jgi:hypothetical protein
LGESLTNTSGRLARIRLNKASDIIDVSEHFTKDKHFNSNAVQMMPALLRWFFLHFFV